MYRLFNQHQHELVRCYFRLRYIKLLSSCQCLPAATTDLCQIRLFASPTTDSNDFRRKLSRQKPSRKADMSKKSNFADKSTSDDTNKEKKNDDKDDEDKMRRRVLFRSLVALIGIMAIPSTLIYVLNRMASSNVEETNWLEFRNKLLPSGEIESIEIIPGDGGNGSIVRIIMHHDAIIDGQPAAAIYLLISQNIDDFEAQLRHAEASMGIAADDAIPINFRRFDTESSLFTIALWIVIPALLILWLRRNVRVRIGFGGFNMKDVFDQKRQADLAKNIIDPHAEKKASAIRFKDIAGLHEPKIEIQEFVDYLRWPNRYYKLGAKLPRGVLLTGPPGCGKTLLAKAVATEASVPFIYKNGPEFIEMIGGEGAARVRTLFETAKQRAPCIIYIDEIDAVGRARNSGNFSRGENDQTLNQLLTSMDGMESSGMVIVMASTNRPDILDKALLRPGRFDRHIDIDVPTLIERREIFEIYLNKITLDGKPERFSRRLARATPGFTGADISNIVNEAAIHAGTAQNKSVTDADLEYALQKVLAGPEKRSSSVTTEEREMIAYYQSGRALVGWLLEHTDALLRISIIPRADARHRYGISQYNSSDRKLYSKEMLFDRMCMTLGGRAAEQVKFGQISTVSSDDLNRVTKSAYAQVRTYGMNENIGPLSFMSMSGGDVNSDQFLKKPYSRRLASIIDIEANMLVKTAYNATEELIRANVDKLDKLATELLKREKLNFDDVHRLIGPPKFEKSKSKAVGDSTNVLPDLDSLVGIDTDTSTTPNADNKDTELTDDRNSFHTNN